MWTLFKKVYSGPLGLFLAGIKYDIPKETAEKLGKFCQPVPAPWDEKIDHKAIACAEDKKNAIIALERAGYLRGKVYLIASKVADLSSAFKTAQVADDEARKLMDKAAEKRTDTNKSQKHFASLKRGFQFADARLQIASSRFAESQAEHTLAELEAEDAEREAAKLAEEAGLEFGPAKRVPDSNGQTISSPSEKSVPNKMS